MLESLVIDFISRMVSQADTETRYRQPLVGFLRADNPGFLELRRVAEPAHLLPGDLLPDARSVVSFFLPFAPEIVRANERESRDVTAREWALAYVQTNALIARITGGLIEELTRRGVRAVAEPPTHNFDPLSLTSRWSHKSIGVLAGLGSFGLHHMVITDAGCAGRFGSLVVEAELRPSQVERRERCLYLAGGGCLECTWRCPVGALSEDGLDKQRCYRRCLEVAETFRDLGLADVCGKCALGPCALQAAL
jgi:epoxyqueuosine reductase